MAYYQFQQMKIATINKIIAIFIFKAPKHNK